MDKITIGKAQKITSPNPFAVLTVKKPDGTTNAMALSWWNYASNHPATVTVCLSKKGYSGECILREKTFGLNIITEEIKKQAYACGTCTGRNVNKAEKTDIPLVEADGYGQMMVDKSVVWMSCRLVNHLEIGDHVLYVGEIDRIEGEDDKKAVFAWNGYGYLTEAEIPAKSVKNTR